MAMVRPSSVSAVAAGEDTTELDRRLAEVDALRKRVLNVIPHALRTPITTFRGLAEALPGATEAEIREQIGPALRRLAAQAEHLLDDMLIAAGYTTALPTLPPEPTPVAETLRAVWAEVGREGELPVTAHEHLDVDALVVSAPPGSLFKILVHLLDNAAKYGDDEIQVDITAMSMRHTTVRIDVCTPGTAPPDLLMLVEPFYRGERAVTRAPGLGVGLTVARALAQQAGGSLEVLARGDDLVARLELRQ
jgi:signal transduction histidine kinase